MANGSVDVQAGEDGSLVVRPHGSLGDDCAVHLRQVLVHAVRRTRPLRLILDLGDVVDVDPINVGTIAALCDLADDHQVVLFVDNPSLRLCDRLRAAGVPQQRLRPHAATIVPA